MTLCLKPFLILSSFRPGWRISLACACYSSDLVMRQYSQVRDQCRRENKTFSYRQIQKVSAADLQEFYQREIEERPRALLVVGDADKVDWKTLEAFGPVRRLSVDEIFPR